jgi:hypothetical protein
VDRQERRQCSWSYRNKHNPPKPRVCSFGTSWVKQFGLGYKPKPKDNWDWRARWEEGNRRDRIVKFEDPKPTFLRDIC